MVAPQTCPTCHRPANKPAMSELQAHGDRAQPCNNSFHQVRYRPYLPDLALSIREPWVHAMVNHGKPIENRSWPTKIRGPICLHASLGMKSSEFDAAMEDIIEILGKSSFEHTASQDGIRRAAYDDYMRTKGCIVATADIVDCVTRHDSPWFFGPYGFVLENVRPVEPFIPVIGKLGFFDWRARLKVAP